MKTDQIFKSSKANIFNNMLAWLIAGITLTILFTSCDSENVLPADQTSQEVIEMISGTYKGSITDLGSGTKSNDATITVYAMNDSTVQLVCSSPMFSDSVMLNIYPDGDFARMCFTDQDFEANYGYPMPDNNYCNNGSWSSNMMNGNMMNNSWQNGNTMTPWMNHTNNVHQGNDEHYGNFDLVNKSLQYKFQSKTSANTNWYECNTKKID